MSFNPGLGFNNQTGLIAVGSEPIPSVYEIAQNGLYLPAQSHYPEFQQAVVQVVTNQQGGLVSMSNTEWASHQQQYQFKMAKLQAQYKKSTWKLSSLVPGLEEPYRIDRCPAAPTGCDIGPSNHLFGMIADAIVHLNDHHQWSRERIANWLDTLENIDLRVKKDPAQSACA